MCVREKSAAIYRKHSATANSEQTACGHNSNNEVIHFIAACPCNRVISESCILQQLRSSVPHIKENFVIKHTITGTSTRTPMKNLKKPHTLLLTFWQPAALTIPNE